MSNVRVGGDMPEHLREKLEHYLNKTADDIKNDVYHSIGSEADSIIFNCLVMNEKKIPELKKSIKYTTSPVMDRFMAYLALLPSVADPSDVVIINKLIEDINSGEKTDFNGVSFISEFNYRVGVTEKFYNNVIRFIGTIH